MTSAKAAARPGRRWREGLALALAAGVGWGASQFWGARQAEQARAELAAGARPGEILMFSATWCGVCKQAHRWLQQAGVPYLACEIDVEPPCRERWQALGGGGTPLFLVKGQTVLGFRPERLAEALKDAGPTAR